MKHPEKIVDRLVALQGKVRDLIVGSRHMKGMGNVARSTSADTIYAIDAVVDPVLEACCEEWGRETPLVLVAEGLEDDHGREGEVVFPRGTPADRAEIRVIVDPIDGTRGLMYDKRPAWALAGVAPNKGPATRLRDIEVAVMTELPTSKMGQADVLWAIKGRGAHGRRVDLATGAETPLPLQPSQATSIEHGFATVSNFFPGIKVLAAELMEAIAGELTGAADVTRATVFDDQYISTGGQFYELIVGHDRFIADVRPILYRMAGLTEGMCAHPYDCACMLIAEEAGIILTDGLGKPLDGPFDTTTGLSWVGYANDTLRKKIEPVLERYLRSKR